MNIKRILSGILAAAMLLCLAACGEGDAPDSTKSSKKTSVTTSVKTPESAPAGGETPVYKLPEGAASEYELYKTVVDYLNNGFHLEDLKNVYDPNLSIVFASKLYEENFTVGMQYEEACALVARLRNIASKLRALTEEEYEELYGDLEDEWPLDEFQSEFPESMQSQINENRDDFGEFIGELIFDDLYRDGTNPFHSDQTVWEAKSESELDSTEMDYNDRYADLYNNFPRIYYIDFEEYRSGNDVFYMSLSYTKIGNRYYLIYFSTTIGTAGG